MRSFPLLPCSSNEERRNIQALVIHHRQASIARFIIMVELGRPLNIFQAPELQDSNQVLNAFLFEHKWLGEPSVSHNTVILDEDEIKFDSLSLYQHSLSLSLSLSLSSLIFDVLRYCFLRSPFQVDTVMSFL